MTLERIIETGTYTGDGNDPGPTITIGWQPAFVMIVSTRTAGSSAGRAVSWKFDTQGTDVNAGLANNASQVNNITINSDGFTVRNATGQTGAQTNDSGTTFHYMAIRAGPWVETGTYTGDGTASQAVALGRQPSMLMVFDETNADGILYHEDSGFTWEKTTGVSFDSTGFSFSSTGFTAGNSATTNVSGGTYNYVAFFDLVGSTRHFESGQYTGDGNASQSITLGVQPQFVVIYSENGGNESYWKSDTMASGDAGVVAAAFNWENGEVQIDSTGFTVQGANNNNNTQVYNFFAGYN